MIDNNNYIKKQLKLILPSVFRLIIIIIGIYQLGINSLQEILIYIICLYCYSTSSKIYNFWNWSYKLMKYIIMTFMIYTMAYYSLGYGTLGFIIFIIIIACIKMFGSKESRHNYMSALRRIESMLFGKSLDKNNWINIKKNVDIKIKGDKDDKR